MTEKCKFGDSQSITKAKNTLTINFHVSSKRYKKFSCLLETLHISQAKVFNRCNSISIKTFFCSSVYIKD